MGRRIERELERNTNTNRELETRNESHQLYATQHKELSIVQLLPRSTSATQATYQFSLRHVAYPCVLGVNPPEGLDPAPARYVLAPLISPAISY